MTAIDLASSWVRAWQGVGAEGEGASVQQALLDRYAEAHRSYHTLQHLAECLATFEAVRHLAVQPAEVELALWFHDAVYDVTRSDNEERSAQWAWAELAAANTPAATADRIAALVLATRHTEAPATADAQLLVDIDLAILGADEPRFAEFERQVRDEYAFVPDAVFRSRRRAILQAFLQRPRIYGTDHFRAAREEMARRNLRRAIAGLAP